MIKTELEARNQGFTNIKRLQAFGYDSLLVLVQDDCDLSGAFAAYDLDDNKLVTVGGWMYDEQE
jgi:hypothetical protein